jgi:PAS domain S-box-containing protein
LEGPFAYFAHGFDCSTIYESTPKSFTIPALWLSSQGQWHGEHGVVCVAPAGIPCFHVALGLHCGTVALGGGDIVPEKGICMPLTKKTSLPASNQPDSSSPAENTRASPSRANAKREIGPAHSRHYDLLFRLAPVGGCVLDRKGVILEVNLIAAAILDISSDESVGLPIFDFILEDDQQRFTQFLQTLWEAPTFLGDETVSCEVRIAREGGVRWVRVDAVVAQVLAAEAVDIPADTSICLAAIHDVSDRKRAEAALSDSEHRWRYILENTPQVGIVLDPDARIIFANQHFLDLTGWEAQEVLGRDWFDMFIPEYAREEIRGVFHSLVTAQDAVGYSAYVNEILTRDGGVLEVAWSNVLTKAADGRILEIACLGIDLTERKRAAAALADQHRLLKAILDTTPSALVLKDRDGVYREVNQAFCDFLGRPREELVGRTDYALFPADEAEAYRAGDVQVMATGIGERGDWLVHGSQGKRWVQVSKTALFNAEGICTGVLCSVTDIDDRMRAEKQARQLQKAESLGRMAGAVAHHFNNQLSVVIGNLELAMGALPGETAVAHNLDEAMEAAYIQGSRDGLPYAHLSGEGEWEERTVGSG